MLLNSQEVSMLSHERSNYSNKTPIIEENEDITAMGRQ